MTKQLNCLGFGALDISRRNTMLVIFNLPLIGIWIEASIPLLFPS
jgi:hypothetical protein